MEQHVHPKKIRAQEAKYYRCLVRAKPVQNIRARRIASHAQCQQPPGRDQNRGDDDWPALLPSDPSAPHVVRLAIDLVDSRAVNALRVIQGSHLRVQPSYVAEKAFPQRAQSLPVKQEKQCRRRDRGNADENELD